MTMQTNPDKIVNVNVPGVAEPYKLYFGMKALRSFEVETGDTVIRVFTTKEISLNSLMILLKHGFKTEHPEIDDDRVDWIVDEVGLETVLQLALEAIGKSLPRQQEGNQQASVIAN